MTMYPTKFFATAVVDPDGHGAAYTTMRSACSGEAASAKILVVRDTYAEAAGDVVMKDGQHLHANHVVMSANVIDISGVITVYISGHLAADITVGAGATLYVDLAYYSGTLTNGGTVHGRAGDKFYSAQTFVTNVRTNGSLYIGPDNPISSIKDENDMASDLDTAIATQQSIKAYADTKTTTAQAVAAAKTVKLDELAAPTDVTTLDFTTALHGLVPKGTDAGNYLKDDGTWAAVSGDGSQAIHAFGDSGANPAVDWDDGRNQKVALNQNAVTFTLANPIADGVVHKLFLVQDATGNRVPAFPASVEWDNGDVAPTWSTAANRMDIIVLIWDNTKSKYWATAGGLGWVTA